MATKKKAKKAPAKKSPAKKSPAHRATIEDTEREFVRWQQTPGDEQTNNGDEIPTPPDGDEIPDREEGGAMDQQQFIAWLVATIYSKGHDLENSLGIAKNIVAMVEADAQAAEEADDDDNRK